VLRPDVTRLGGITPWLKVAALAGFYRCPLSAAGLPEICVQLACAVPEARAVECVPWLAQALAEPPALAKGQLIPSQRPGMGIEIRADVLTRCRFSR
jgi:L-alanine-DL-glutamate epimerase-like enolase superfamily enzyme